MARSFEIDMTKGPLFKQIVLYSLPIVGINLVQLLFNAADVAILGIFSSDAAVGAVGSTTAIVNLIIGFFMGMTISANVLVARYKGANNQECSDKTIGTSVCISLIFGLCLTLIGIFGSRTFLKWMNCKEQFLDMATTYMQIYFLGMPIIMLYNFSASVMRAVGDTLRPFIFLVIGGILNIGLNIFFIVILHKDVEGVAIATVASQGVAAALSLFVLARGKGFARIKKKYLKIDKQELFEILRIGVPTGLQRCVFSLSNVVLNSTLNTFEDNIITANTIAHQFDAIIHDVTAAFAMSTTAFVSQNLGAKNYARIWKAIGTSLVLVFGVSMIVGTLVFALAEPLCSIMTNTPEVIEYGVKRLSIMSWFYCLTGASNVFSCALRSLGKATLAMVGSLFSTVVLRIVWIYTIFPINPILEMYYAIYPISWGINALLCGIFMLIALKNNQRKYEQEKLCKEQQITEQVVA